MESEVSSKTGWENIGQEAGVNLWRKGTWWRLTRKGSTFRGLWHVLSGQIWIGDEHESRYTGPCVTQSDAVRRFNGWIGRN